MRTDPIEVFMLIYTDLLLNISIEELIKKKCGNGIHLRPDKLNLF